MSSKHSTQSAHSAQSPQSAQAFEEALGELVRRAEDEGIDLSCARDVEASEDGHKYMIEISRVRES